MCVHVFIPQVVPLMFMSQKAIQCSLLYHLRELEPICRPIIEFRISIPWRLFLLPAPLTLFFPYFFLSLFTVTCYKYG